MDEPEIEEEYELACPQCGHIVSENDLSCPGCGMSFQACPRCQAPIGEHDEECSNCGCSLLESKEEGAEPIKATGFANKFVSGFMKLMTPVEKMEMLEMDPRREVEQKFYQPHINLIQSGMVMFLFIVSIGLLLNFTLYKDLWYEHFSAFNGFLMAITSVGIIIGLAIVLTSTPETPRRIYKSRTRTIVGLIGGIMALISLVVLLIWGDRLGTTNVLMNILLFVGIICLIQMSPTLSNREVGALSLASIGFLLILMVPVHEALGPYMTDFRYLPWAAGNEIMLVLGIIIFGAGYVSLRMNTSFLVVWLLGAIVLFLIPFHETVGIVASTNYEPWDHMLSMIGITISALGSVGFLVKKWQYDKMAFHLVRGNQFLASGNSTQSLIEYNEAVEISIKADVSTDYATPWFSMANGLALDGRPDEALSQYDIALNIEPEDSNILVNKGNCLCQLNRPLDALVCYEKALELNAKHVDAWFHKGLIEKLLGKLELAEFSLQKVVDLSPSHLDGIILLAQVKSLLGHYKEALELLDAGKVAYPMDLRFYVEISQVHLEQGKVEKAEHALEPALNMDANYFQAVIMEAKISLFKGDYLEAYRVLERIKSSDMKELEFVLIWVKVLMLMDKFNRAGRTLEAAIEYHGEKTELLSLAAFAYENILYQKQDMDWCPGVKGDDIEEAVISLINGNPDIFADVVGKIAVNSDVFFNSITVRRKFSRIVQRDWAMRIQELILFDAAEDNVAMMAVAIYLDMEWYREKAITMYRKVINRSIGISEDVSLPAAITFFDNVIARDENNIDAHTGKIRAQLELRQFDEALASAERVREMFPEHAETLNLKAEVLLKLRRFEEAISILEHCLVLDPEHIHAWLNLGNARVKMGDIVKAIECFNSALMIDPDFLPAIRNRNICMNAIVNEKIIHELLTTEEIITTVENAKEVSEEATIEEEITMTEEIIRQANENRESDEGKN